MVQCDACIGCIVHVNTWLIRLAFDESTKDYIRFLYENIPLVFKMQGFLVHFFYHCQTMSTIMLCVHRLSIATFPNSPKIWYRYYRIIYVAVIGYGFGMTMIPNFITGSRHMTYNYELQKFSFVYETEGKLNFGWFLWYESIVYLCVIVSIGIMTVYMILKRFEGKFSSESRLIRSRMTKIVATHTVIHFYVIAWQLLSSSGTLNIDNKVSNALMMIASDLMSLSTPYVLFIWDVNVRRIVMDFLKFVYAIAKSDSVIPTIS
ncbi:unnamed protein product [Caenorhabditis bovis]|uniref:Serpentine receptor class gamma n=1 Tax=Caenorhabditis bovis TaxID=2654633 RepID=A0A8S1EDC3_9PELO|nr:unnamed protein product [Caenorhabditis bovis]